MRPDVDEALRYLGAGGSGNEALRDRMEALGEEVARRCRPRWIWRAAEVRTADGVVAVGGIALPGRSAAKMLAECPSAAVLVCTLGMEFEGWIRQMQARDMAQAVMLDALGSAFVEAGCSAAEEEIASRFPGLYLTDRFSPGYGDLPLESQTGLLALTQAQRIGVYETPAHLMTPQKSVSAVIGLSDRPQMARIRGCAYCKMQKTCTLRKAGKTCDV